MRLGNDKQLSKISEIGIIKIDKDEIKGVDKTTYLGLTKEERLSWNQQYETVQKKNERRTQFYQKTQRYAITIVSSIPSTGRKLL